MKKISVFNRLIFWYINNENYEIKIKKENVLTYLYFEEELITD